MQKKWNSHRGAIARTNTIEVTFFGYMKRRESIARVTIYSTFEASFHTTIKGKKQQYQLSKYTS